MNLEGYKGLIPKFGGGRPSKLTKENKEELKKILKEKRFIDNKRSTEILGKIWNKILPIPYKKDSKIFHMGYNNPYRKITGTRQLWGDF